MKPAEKYVFWFVSLKRAECHVGMFCKVSWDGEGTGACFCSSEKALHEVRRKR